MTLENNQEPDWLDKACQAVDRTLQQESVWHPNDRIRVLEQCLEHARNESAKHDEAPSNGPYGPSGCWPLNLGESANGNA